MAKGPARKPGVSAMPVRFGLSVGVAIAAMVVPVSSAGAMRESASTMEPPGSPIGLSLGPSFGGPAALVDP